MELISFPLLFFTGFVASFIGTNAGGGGLLLVPVLIFLGLSPHAAVATRRVASIGAIPTGLYCFAKEGKVKKGVGIRITIAMALGAFVGSKSLFLVSAEQLQQIIGVFILFILVTLLLKKDIGVKSSQTSNSLLGLLGYLGYFFIGIAAGLVGGGGQVLGNMILISCFGLTFLEAAGTRKIATLTSAIVALSVYIPTGFINWPFGLTLLCGSTIGSYMGSRFGLKQGDEWVRKLFIVVVCIAAIKLLW